MTILKTDTVRANQHLVGVHVGHKVYAYMSLYCVAKGTLKSRIFTKLFLDWMSLQKLNLSEEKLRKMIIEKIQAQRNKHPERDMNEFLLKVEDELLRKGVPVEHVSKILGEII